MSHQHTYQAHRTDSGAALILCTVFMAMTLVILATISTRIVSQARHIDQAEHAVRALAAAEYAAAQAVAALQSGGSGAVGFSGIAQFDAQGDPAVTFDDPSVVPVSPPGEPAVQYFTYAVDWGADGGKAGDVLDQGLHTLYVFARSGPVERRLEVVLREENGNFKQLSWRELPPKGVNRAKIQD